MFEAIAPGTLAFSQAVAGQGNSLLFLSDGRYYRAVSYMRTVIVTGSAGLIGSETVRRFATDGARVVGIYATDSFFKRANEIIFMFLL
jgi:hypothetical protein